MNEIALSAALTMSSKEIADLTNKEHKNVMADIRKMLDELGLRSADFSANVADAYGRLQPAFFLPKRETLILVSGYSIAMRARIVDRWQELESQVAASALPDFTNPAVAARAWADEVDKNLALQQQVIEAAPKVAALERLTVAAQGAMCITDAAKNLQEQPKRVFEWMQSNGWIYRRPGNATWTAYQDKIQRGVLEHKITTVHRTDGSEKVTTQVLVTAKGLTEIAQKMRGADLH
ncbi:phage antirepressor KilAC domain-containing protein [Caballeronia grimmiae]|uniref:DNA-binding protein n=1 Tax=Caballeronia grimmiae TaxID=1071679 RepID=A0ABQ1RC79_9BURK|nr:phage regulatory protein/antirepressor Ant [Caballeronia grimmiae]GGD63192.1 DNA-binding protein [Caballeronia grimmiae]